MGNSAYIALGHIGKTRSQMDPGAQDAGVIEAIENVLYGAAMAAEFARNGWNPFLDGAHDYSTRQARANALRTDLFLCPHINAGKGDYGLIVYDYRSTRGRTIAEKVAGILEGKWSREVKTGDSRRFDRAHGLIENVGAPVSFVLEPFFVDNPKHRAWYWHYTPARMGVDFARAFMESF